MTCVCWLAFCLLGASQAGELTLAVTPAGPPRNLLPNPSFERVGADGRTPAQWRWIPGRTDAALAVVSPGRQGGAAVRLTNGTPLQPHVYGQLTCGPVPVTPRTRYTLSFWARAAASPGAAWVGGGQGWTWRIPVPETGGAWRRVAQSFVTGDETSIPLMINTDSPTTGFEIDDVQLEAGPLSPFHDPQAPPAHAIDLAPATRAATWCPELYPPERWAFVDQDLLLTGSLSLRTARPDARVEVRLLAGDRQFAQARTTEPLPARAVLSVRYPTPADLPAELRVEARLLGVDPATACVGDLRVVTRATTERLLAATAAALPALERKAEADDDARVTATTVRWFLDWTRADLAQPQLDRAYDTARRLGAMVAAALAAPTRERAPRWVTGPLSIDGPAFVGDMVTPHGERARRPVWFVGWGHFGEVRRRVEQFPALGTNIIQVEFGPSAVLRSDTEYNDQPIREFLSVCDRAAAAGVAVNLLLSPHYFPPWALARWSELKAFDGGFLKYCLHDPRAKGVIERFLRYVVPRVKGHPALHSLCLSNEPLCIDQRESLAAVRMWQDWLRARWPTVAALNARWGTQYADFAAVCIPEPRWTRSAVTYDYTRFNSEAFARWHGWMADIVHELAPRVPVHAKIMIFAHFGPSLHGPWSVSPERFAAATDILGNDCIKWPRASGEWACDWLAENMGYDYQRSCADRPVFNSENHLIRDRDLSDVSPEFIRNVYWQGAVHGQGATTTWVLERTTDPASDFAGSIAHRPQCLESAGLTCLDLNRAAPEVAALAKEPAAISLLWSHAALVWNTAHPAAAARVYEAANFLDQPVGFVNEDDCEHYAAGRPNRALDRTKLLLLPAVSHVTDSVGAALERFRRHGGTVLVVGDPPTRDEADRVRPSWPADGRLALATAHELWTHLRAQAPAPRVAVGVWGVEARSALLGARTVLNLCNFRREPVSVNLPAGAVDRLSGARLGRQLELASLVPRLLVLDG